MVWQLLLPEVEFIAAYGLISHLFFFVLF